MKILIDNGHGSTTSGKRSPDGRLKEYAYCREIAKLLVEKLRINGYDAQRVVTEEGDIRIGERCRRVNAICRIVGARNCLLISVHNNAFGSDGNWHAARGFSVFVSKNASSRSKLLSELLFQRAKAMGLMGNRSVPMPDDKGRHFWTWSWRKDDIGILANTNCPAVLTENFFQDNKADVDFMLSEEGKQKVVKLHYDAIMNYIKEVEG